jgi:hypothetical protein
MQIFIFDNTTNSLRIDDYSILLVKEFAKLWEPERNKCKEDKKGELRIRAYKELTYIYLVLDFKSPYFKYLEKDKHEAALADSGLTEADLEDDVFLAAFRKYREIQEEDPILALIKTAYNTIYKMRIHLDNIDFSEVDADGKPIYKPKDVIADLTSISKIRTELKTLEELHKTSMEAEAAVRGGVSLGMLD